MADVVQGGNDGGSSTDLVVVYGAAVPEPIQQLERERNEIQVESADAALRVLKRRQPDCLLVVPDDAFDPVVLVERAGRTSHDIPIVVYDCSDAAAVDALDAGAAAVLGCTGSPSPALLARKLDDVVDDHRGSRRAHEQAQRIRALLSGSSDRLTLVDEQGQFEFVSPASPPVLNRRDQVPVDPDETPRTGLFDGVVADDVQALRDSFEEVLGDPGSTQQVEYRIDADNPVWVESRLTNRFDDPVLDGIVVTTREITHRKEQQRQFETQKHRAQTLFDRLPEPTIEFSFAGTQPVIEQANAAFEETFGCDSAAVTGKPVDDVVVPENKQAEAALLNEAVQDGDGSVSKEVARQTPDGVQTFLFRAATYSDGERGFAVYTDITDRKEREQTLKRQTELFERVQRIADIGAWEYAAGAETAWTTARLRELFDLPPDEEPSLQEWFERFHPDDRDRIEQALDRAIEAGEPYDLEARVGRGGDERWVRAQGEPDGGDTIRGTVTDITDRKRREEKLREQQAFTEAILSALPDILYVFDEHGNFLRWNDRVEEVTGYSGEQLSEMQPTDFVVPEDRAEAVEAMATVVEEGETTKTEARLQTADGETIPYELTGARMVDDDGTLLGIVGIGRNLSDRKRRQRRFEAVFNNTYQFTGLMEPDGTVIEVNDTALSFGGIDREDVIGKPLWEAHWFQGSDDAREVARESVEVATTGALYREEVTVKGSEGTEVIDFSVRPITDADGTVTLLVPEGRVITGLKRREQHLRTLNRFLRHNLRNKMTVVEGTAELLGAELADTEYEQHVTQIIDAADELTGLSETAREFIQVTIEASAEQEPTAVRPVIERAAATVRDDHDHATIDVETDSDAQVLVDWRLERAIEQLIENGIVHAESATPVVTITTDTQDGLLSIQLTDQCPTIPDDELVGIVDDGEPDQLIHGSGFGLRLAKAVIDEYGGELDHEAQAGGGNRMILRVPIADPDG